MPSISSFLPVGTILESMLTEAQFQSEAGAEWVLCDGRTAAGTRYNAVTGQANIPDARGLFRRGKNNGRSDGNQDPSGDVALGTFQASRNLAHDHDFSDPQHRHQSNVLGDGGFGGQGTKPGSNLTNILSGFSSTGIIFNSNGGADARPNCLVVNLFIKIN